jgi:hypothetical protein
LKQENKIDGRYHELCFHQSETRDQDSGILLRQVPEKKIAALQQGTRIKEPIKKGEQAVGTHSKLEKRIKTKRDFITNDIHFF